jgi:PAS domain S-box-containing protein
VFTLFDLQQIQRAGFEEVLRQMPAGVVIAEAPSGKIMFVNRRAQEWTEQSPSQTRRTKLEDAGDFEIFHPDGRTYEMEEWPLMRSIRDGEEVRDEEFVYPLADGTGLLLRCNSSPVYDEEGRIVAGVLVARDITEQKRAEEKLKRSEERFRLMVEGVRDYAIFMLDPNGHIESWNEGARRIKGYSQEEILGQHFSIFYPPEDVERGKPEHELREAEAKGVYEEEGWRVRKDGSRFWASVLITALRDEAGQLRGFSKVTRDITERKQAGRRCTNRVGGSRTSWRASPTPSGPWTASGATPTSTSGPCAVCNREGVPTCRVKRFWGRVSGKYSLRPWARCSIRSTTKRCASRSPLSSKRSPR